MNHFLSRIPKPICKTLNNSIQYDELNRVVGLDICKRRFLDRDLENKHIRKYFNLDKCRAEEHSKNECDVYIHKIYTIHGATDFLDKHTRRMCILYFCNMNCKDSLPYSRTFSISASEIDEE